MHAVAIIRLQSTVEREAEALAADLGTVSYEERLKLAAGLPSVVLLTPDATRAAALLDRVRGRGHVAVACATDDVVPQAQMISLRRFRLDDDALVAADRPDARLPWSDLAALIRATDRTRVESVDQVKDKRFDLGRALATGGLIRSRTTRREVTTRVDDSEQLLYLFRRSGQTPWILREQGTHYGALGAQLASTALPNFLATVERLRLMAPEARVDERLLSRRLPRASAPLRGGRVTSANDLDLLAHLVALDLAGHPA